MGAGGSGRRKAQTGPEIQQKENCNTSTENMGSNVQQRKCEFQKKKMKVKYDRKGNIKFIEMYQKYLNE